MAKPVAVKDTNAIYLSDTDGTISGNVLANDVKGSEGDTLSLRFLNGERVSDIGKGGDNTVVGKYGTFTIFNDGSYTYKLDTANADVINAGATGENLVERVSYKVSNGSGETDFDYLAIDIFGRNTKPLAVNDVFDASSGTVSGNVLFNDIDPEGGLAVARAGGENTGTPARNDYVMKFVGEGAATEVEGVYGTLSIEADGSFTYTVDPTDPDTIALGGQAATDFFQYRIKDGAFGAGLPNEETTDVGIIQITINDPSDALSLVS